MDYGEGEGSGQQVEPRGWFAGLRRRAGQIKQDTYALYLAYRDPRVAWYAKLFAALVVAYAFSPLDLIPDFLPVLGYLDDLLLIPLGITLAVRMIPPAVMTEARRTAREQMRQNHPGGQIAALVIIVIWLALFAWVASFVYTRISR